MAEKKYKILGYSVNGKRRNYPDAHEAYDPEKHE
jgi:hypothetical protein